jgi:hypothetical protein
MHMYVPSITLRPNRKPIAQTPGVAVPITHSRARPRVVGQLKRGRKKKIERKGKKKKLELLTH